MTDRSIANAIGLLAFAVMFHGCITSASKADEYTPDARMTIHADPPPGAVWFARVVIQNRIGTYNRVETLDTAHGPVALEYTTTPPHRLNDPASADRVCVVALPDGVQAVPECLDVMEQESGTVLLMKWIGG